MNKHLWQRVTSLLEQYHTATLSTCSHADPQVSVVPYQVIALQVALFVTKSSDHLFHIEHHPNVVLLTNTWKLHGQGRKAKTNQSITSPHDWQRVILVHPTRLHILNPGGSGYAETIDLE